jgi:hypothetical protein
MLDEATIHLESEPDPEAVHDAVTAAITEAEHREDVEESLEQIEEATDAWQSQQTAILGTQQAILGALLGIQTTLSQWTTRQEQIVADQQPSEMLPDTSSREEIPGDSSPERTAEAVEVLVVEDRPEPGTSSEQQQQQQPERAGANRFYSPLRNLLQARKRREG